MGLDTRTLTGSAIALLGASRLLLSFEYLLSPEFVVLAAGGWILVGLGAGLIAGRATIATRIPDRRFGVAGPVASNALSLVLVAMTVRMLVAG